MTCPRAGVKNAWHHRPVTRRVMGEAVPFGDGWVYGTFLTFRDP